jgi:hypothetical protein
MNGSRMRCMVPPDDGRREGGAGRNGAMAPRRGNCLQKERGMETIWKSARRIASKLADVICGVRVEKVLNERAAGAGRVEGVLEYCG